MTDEQTTDRRTVLAATGAGLAAALGLAGCQTEAPGDGEPGATPEGMGEDGAGGTETEDPLGETETETEAAEATETETETEMETDTETEGGDATETEGTGETETGTDDGMGTPTDTPTDEQ